MDFFSYEDTSKKDTVDESCSDSLNDNLGKVNVFKDIVLSRRSVRAFSEEVVPEEIIREALELSLISPNTSNIQPWEFHWIRDKEKKDKLEVYCLNQYVAKSASDLIVCVGRTKSWKRNRKLILEKFVKKEAFFSKQQWNYFDKICPAVYELGFLGLKGLYRKVAKFFTGMKGPVVREPCFNSEMKTLTAINSGLAAQTFMLSIHALGYDSCPMGAFDSVRVKKLLALPSDSIITMVIAVGTKDNRQVEFPRFRLENSYFIKEHL